MKKQGLEVPSEVDDAAVLTSFAWEARYAGPGEPVTEEEYQEAIKLAETVVTWVDKKISV